jgi:histidine triad (HIT) family protein
MTTSECIFCKIVGGAIPAQKVDETDEVFAFRDIHPQAPTHVLLIPKRHVAESASELGPGHAALLGDLFALAARIAEREGLSRGWRLVTNVGEHAGQTVSHLHIHLLGGRPMRWPPG